MSTKDTVGTGFAHPPGYDIQRTVLSWHFYCWLLDVDTHPIINGSYPNFAHQFCDEWQLATYFSVVEKDLIRYLIVNSN